MWGRTSGGRGLRGPSALSLQLLHAEVLSGALLARGRSAPPIGGRRRCGGRRGTNVTRPHCFGMAAPLRGSPGAIALQK